MPRRTKVLVIALVVVVGAMAALVFRKKSATVDDAPTAAAATPAASRELQPLPEKPAPTSRLTGRIESPDSVPGGSSPAGPGGNATFGFPTPATGAGAFSARPSSEDRGIGGAETADQLSGSATSALGASYSELTRHRVIDGDTLSGLALKYLGSADRYREIFELNRDVLASPDLLPIGAEVKIPAGRSIIPQSTSPSTRPMVPVAPRNRT
jgi:nucleoid-associated protein YgaU